MSTNNKKSIFIGGLAIGFLLLTGGIVGIAFAANVYVVIAMAIIIAIGAITAVATFVISMNTQPASLKEKTKETSGEKTKETSGEKTKETSGEKTKETSGEKTKETSGEKTKETSGEKTKETSGEKTKETSGEKTKEESIEVDPKSAAKQKINWEDLAKHRTQTEGKTSSIQNLINKASENLRQKDITGEEEQRDLRYQQRIAEINRSFDRLGAKQDAAFEAIQKNAQQRVASRDKEIAEQGNAARKLCEEAEANSKSMSERNQAEINRSFDRLGAKQDADFEELQEKQDAAFKAIQKNQQQRKSEMESIDKEIAEQGNAARKLCEEAEANSKSMSERNQAEINRSFDRLGAKQDADFEAMDRGFKEYTDAMESIDCRSRRLEKEIAQGKEKIAECERIAERVKNDGKIIDKERDDIINAFLKAKEEDEQRKLEKEAILLKKEEERMRIEEEKEAKQREEEERSKAERREREKRKREERDRRWKIFEEERARRLAAESPEEKATRRKETSLFWERYIYLKTFIARNFSTYSAKAREVIEELDRSGGKQMNTSSFDYDEPKVPKEQSERVMKAARMNLLRPLNHAHLEEMGVSVQDLVMVEGDGIDPMTKQPTKLIDTQIAQAYSVQDPECFTLLAAND